MLRKLFFIYPNVLSYFVMANILSKQKAIMSVNTIEPYLLENQDYSQTSVIFLIKDLILQAMYRLVHSNKQRVLKNVSLGRPSLRLTITPLRSQYCQSLQVFSLTTSSIKHFSRIPSKQKTFCSGHLIATLNYFIFSSSDKMKESFILRYIYI